MSDLEIRPGRAVGPLRLGMTEAEALAAMASIGVEGERRQRWDLSADPPVQYDEVPAVLRFAGCLMAAFDDEGRLGFVELSDGPLRGLVDGVDVLAADQARAVTVLARATGEDPIVEEDGTTIFPRAAASLWRGGDDERRPGRWEAVGTGPPGYFD